MRIESLITLRIINTVRKNVNTSMFQDGIKDKKADDKVKVLDLAEIVAGALK